MPVRIYYWCIIGGKERRRAKRRGQGRPERTSTRVVRGKKGRASEKWRTYLSARARETERMNVARSTDKKKTTSSTSDFDELRVSNKVA